jgi:hypothetical protein
VAADLVPTFERLRALFAAYAGRAVVLHDEPTRYYLGTHEVRAKVGYRTLLGGVEIKKAYVSAHLMLCTSIPTWRRRSARTQRADAGEVLLQLQAKR